MARILLAEDEKKYREHLTRLLEGQGHSVTAVSEGLEAVRAGVRMRPEVVVVDWMLGDQTSGLEVAKALRLLQPNLPTMMITGFFCDDLSLDAEAAELSEILPKPFGQEEFSRRVNALCNTAEGDFRRAIGFVELDDHFNPVFANPVVRPVLAAYSRPRAKRRFCEVAREMYELRIADQFGERDSWQPLKQERFTAGLETEDLEAGDMAAAEEEWVATVIKFDDQAGFCCFFIRREEEELRYTPEVELVVRANSRAARSVKWPLSERFLVIDDEAFQRRLVSSQIQLRSGSCHVAASYEQGLATVKKDERVRFVLLDFEMPDRHDFPGGLSGFVRALRQARPEIVVIGNSGVVRQSEFKKSGVELFLSKPWSMDDLARELLQHFKLQRGSAE